MKQILIIFLFILSINAFGGEPAPIGLEIGKTTVKEMLDKYSAEIKGISTYSKGEVYEIDI